MSKPIADVLKAIMQSYPLKASVIMTIGLCFHFFGYECTRAASITLLAAKVYLSLMKHKCNSN